MVKTADIFSTYSVRFDTADAARRWLQKCHMGYWQNQLNFAVWCASAGCGVTWNDHLDRPSLPLILGIFRFHVYFQTRKILHEMGCPLPSDGNFNQSNNHIDLTAFNRLCREFGIETTEDFRCKLGPIGGAGTLYTKEFGRLIANTQPGLLNWSGLPKVFDHVQQENVRGWVNFIPRDGLGLPKAGVARINSSIRAYVYCVLGAQAQTRSAITGNTNTAFDVQKQFTTLMEDAIHGEGSSTLVQSINRYQNAIASTHSKLDYAIGPNLYLIPSDMVLNMASVVQYNNDIQVADVGMDLGVNNVNHARATGSVRFANSKIKRTQRPALHMRENRTTVVALPPVPHGIENRAPAVALPERQDNDDKRLYFALGVSGVVGLAVHFLRRV